MLLDTSSTACCTGAFNRSSTTCSVLVLNKSSTIQRTIFKCHPMTWRTEVLSDSVSRRTASR